MHVTSNNLDGNIMTTSNQTILGEHKPCHAPPGLKWACLEAGVPVSDALPYTGVMLVAFLIIFGLIKQYVLEGFLMGRTSLYRDTWARLPHRDQRTLVNHHLSLGVKSFILLIAIVPFMFIVNGHQFAYSPITGSHVSVGDMMFIVSNMYTAMYAFELCYRTGISPVAWAHHTGTAIMAQYALVLSHDGHHRDGSLEQILCLVWGLFDIVSEAIPHFTFILYRLFPTRHAYLHRWLLTATVVMLVSTALETGIVVWIYVALFSRWRSELRFLTPFMYCIFAVAQLWGAWALWGLTQKQKRLVESERGGVCLCLVVKVEEVRKNGGDDIELNVVNVVQPVNNKV